MADFTRMRPAGVVAGLLIAAALTPGCSSENSSEAAVTEAAAATAASSTTVDPGQLLGTWTLSGSVFLTLEPDGTWYGNSKVYLEDGSWYVAGDKIDPFHFGTYTFDGSVLTVASAAESRCPGISGSYSVTFVDADTATMDAVTEDECVSRFSSFTTVPLERVEVLSSEG
jgi:hypothetical protein